MDPRWKRLADHKLPKHMLMGITRECILDGKEESRVHNDYHLYIKQLDESHLAGNGMGHYPTLL